MLRAVRTHWSSDVERIEPLVPGRWCALVGLRPTYLVAARDPGEVPALETTYDAVAELAFRLDVVVPALATGDGARTARLGPTTLTATPWVMGEPAGTGDPVTTDDADRTAGLLARLHAVRPPRGLLRWHPHDAPLPADATRGAEKDRERYDELLREHADALAAAPLVVTHGCPDLAHQRVTPVRTLLTGWHRARLAPAERDLHVLPADHPRAGDAGLRSLFGLEGRLRAASTTVGR